MELPRQLRWGPSGDKGHYLREAWSLGENLGPPCLLGTCGAGPWPGTRGTGCRTAALLAATGSRRSREDGQFPRAPPDVIAGGARSSTRVSRRVRPRGRAAGRRGAYARFSPGAGAPEAARGLSLTSPNGCPCVENRDPDWWCLSPGLCLATGVQGVTARTGSGRMRELKRRGALEPPSATGRR